VMLSAFIFSSFSLIYRAKYRGGVRRTEGLENTGGGDDIVETPLFLLIIDEIRECPQGEEVNL
uniref:hypothetical protein n=1 Tax=Barnesiella intestinihominis TaxID=487174 RepID=UPI00403865CB